MRRSSGAAHCPWISCRRRGQQCHRVTPTHSIPRNHGSAQAPRSACGPPSSAPECRRHRGCYLPRTLWRTEQQESARLTHVARRRVDGGTTLFSSPHHPDNPDGSRSVGKPSRIWKWHSYASLYTISSKRTVSGVSEMMRGLVVSGAGFYLHKKCVPLLLPRGFHLESDVFGEVRTMQQYRTLTVRHARSHFARSASTSFESSFLS